MKLTKNKLNYFNIELFFFFLARDNGTGIITSDR